MTILADRIHKKTEDLVLKAFAWSEHFITGLKDVDEQHQNLVALINQFGEHLTDEDKICVNEIDSIFNELAEYAKYHFAEEEQLIKQEGVDKRYISHHHGLHQRFIKEVTEMHNNLSDNKVDVDIDAASSLFEFLTHWLAYHILGEDKLLAKQIELINDGVNPIDAYQRVSTYKDDATEPLLVALNGLFQQVSERNHKLIELNRTLEEKVKERTQELRDLNLHLEELAHTDLLTGLPNRRHAMHFLEKAWTESCHDDTPLACIIIDADGFKQVNDQYGHDAGDHVLRELSKCLQHSFRTDDFVSRLGGDEFMVILQKTDLEGGRNIAEIVRTVVSDMRVQIYDGIWGGSISVGVAQRSSMMENLDALIKAADRAVYQSKKNGRNRVECFDNRLDIL